MVVPALLALILPLASYFLLGVEGVGGVLIGQTVSGFVMAVYMANAGALGITQRSLSKVVSWVVKVLRPTMPQ